MGYHMFTTSFPLTAADERHELRMACHLGRQFMQRRQERSHDPAAFLNGSPSESLLDTCHGRLSDDDNTRVSSGKRLHNYGKSPSLSWVNQL